MSLAPELSSSLEWVNTPPVRLAALRGHVVALAFFNADSAYGRNLLEELRVLQARHAEGLRVIGVHVPKFEAERSARLAHKTVNRLGLRFPVAHDGGFVAWQHYGLRVWPSVVLISPLGQVVATVQGDRQREVLEHLITRTLDETALADRVFNAAQPALRPEPPSALAFPTGLAATPAHLYVADSGHHRILECTHEGRVLRQFGSASNGFIDGSGSDASFCLPRGLCLAKDLLYVADTGNHAVRRIKLSTGEVETLAGTGRAGATVEAADPRQQMLDQPSGLAMSSDRLYIALAGSNQIAEYDLMRRKLSVLAGSGKLGLSDGPLASAAFAQPTDLALVQHTLYVSDAAASAVRSVNLGSGQVQTLLGQGLFSAGHADGPRASALMQRCQGLAMDPRSPLLWIVDSYNNCLRRLRLGGGNLETLEIDPPPAEPTSLCLDGGHAWLSSTHGHEVLRIDLETGEARRLPIDE